MKNIITTIKNFYWFTINSYKYIVTDEFESKVEYCTGFFKAWKIFNKGMKIGR